MRNKYLIIIACLYSFLCFSQAIEVSTTQYTPEQLVKEILINNPCANVSNVTWKTGTDFGVTDGTGIGYFENTNPDFDMTGGIILSTGNAKLAEGPENSIQGVGNTTTWLDDPDLTNYIRTALGVTDDYYNATILEFDFVPYNSAISFNFIFASEEYGGFQCGFSDSFAFFLTNTATNVTTNLALVPGTGDPISVTTIRDGAYNIGDGNGMCDDGNPISMNEQYFGSYNDGNVNSAINFIGQTVKMVAESDVVPLTKYHIKLVIQDRQDSSYDSGVFLEAGSFQIGNLDLGDPVLIENGEGLCVGDSYILESGMDPLIFTFEWFKDGVKIPGETGANLVITETGEYNVTAFMPVSTGCSLESEPVLIEFYDYVSLDQSPFDLEACPTSGVFTRFDLEDAMVGTTSNTNLRWKFYESQQDANDDTNALSNLYDLANSTTGSKTIWVRVYEQNNPCYYVTSFTLSFLNCNITLNQLDNLSICEGDAVQTFDLTVQTALVYNNALGYDVTYHQSQQDAANNQNAIATGNLSAYAGTDGERIWVRVTNTSNPAYYGLTSFYLFKNKLPETQVTILPITACENGTTGMGDFDLNLAYKLIPTSPVGVSLEFYETQQDAFAGTSSLKLPAHYTGSAKTIYVRVRNLDGDCFKVVPLQLELINTPAANSIAPITYCDLNNDGFGEFNLDPYKVLIGGNPLPAHAEVTFHETQGDADANINAIKNTGTYVNKVANQQTIYARVGYTNSSCYATVAVTLQVNKTPAITPIGRMAVCDIDNDKVEDFDLTSMEPDLLKGLVATNYTVTYHITANAAMSGTGVIGNPQSFSSSVSKEVYVRVEDNATGCFAVTRVALELVAMPQVANPLPAYYLCDTDGDGFETFDLASQIPAIMGAQHGLEVTFHYTNSDAQSGTNALPLKYQNGSANVQTIYVRVSNPSAGCYVVTTLKLEVLANPVLNVPTDPYIICSDSGYGTLNIYLYGKDLVDASGEDYAFQFYETQSDAEDKINEISNPIAYNNLKPNNPTVWIRVEDDLSGCYSVYPITFQLVVPPKLPASLPDLEECDVVGSTQDEVTIFDLTQQNAALLAAQSVQGIYQIRYFTSQQLADSNTDWIADPTQFQNTTNPQTIWVRIEDSSLPGSCARIMSFKVRVHAPLRLNQPQPLVQCDTDLPNDGKGTFDLTVRERDILGGQIFGAVITYHLTKQEAENGWNAVPDPTQFTNTANPQTIYVSVENQYGCRSIITMTVRVLPLPEPNLTPTPLAMCEDLENPGMAMFDLTKAESDLSNYSDYDYSYFTDEIGAQTNDDATKINNPGEFLSGNGTVYVRVVNTFTDTNLQCAVVVPLELVVNPNPVVGPMTNLPACMENPRPTTKFNLRDKDAEALAGANPDDFIVTYYGSENDAEYGVSPVPYIFTNTTENEQEMWVRVENKATGCFSIASFWLQIEQKVYAYRPTDPSFCETDYDNDGKTVADLTVMDEEVIGNQPLTDDLLVRYYRQDGTLITDPTAVTIHEGEVLMAEVYNSDSELMCSATVEITVHIKDAPEVLPLKDGIVCYEYRDQWSIISGHYLETGIPEGVMYDITWTRDGESVVPDVADIIDGGRRLYVKRGGSYEVTVTDPETGCSTTRSAVVREAPSVTLDEVIITDSFGDTNALEVIAYAGENYEMEYKLDEGPWQESNIFLEVTPGEHTVYVRVSTDLSCEVSRVITVMDYPKFFTPNDDGYNDTWNIWSLKNQPKSKIYIFDRFGKLIKQLSPAGSGWDGTFNGHPLPSTDYWFKAEYIDSKTGLQKEVTGHFSLKR